MPIQNSETTQQNNEIPAHLDRWNWGAFLLNWIWGIGNGVLIALLCLIPVFGFVMMFVLGARGSRWAWQNRLWRDEEHFRRTQRRWAIAGVIVWLAVLLLFAGMVFGIFGALKSSEAFKMSMAGIRASQTAQAALGDDIEAGFFVTGQVHLDLHGGRAVLQIPVTGSRASGTAYSQAIKEDGVWTLKLLLVRVPGRSDPIVIINETGSSLPGGPLDT